MPDSPEEEVTLPTVCDWCDVGQIIDPTAPVLSAERWLCADCEARVWVRSQYEPVRGQSVAWIAHLCRLRRLAMAGLPLFGDYRADKSLLQSREPPPVDGYHDCDRDLPAYQRRQGKLWR